MKKKPKKISAQKQVKNRVNAGLMDFALCNENVSNIREKYYELMKSLILYMNENINLKPFPNIILKNNIQDGFFITTGYYEPFKKRIVLFINNRHPKDILRSLAHELIHHNQNLRGEKLNYNSNDNVKDNKNLENLESEAYLKGNILFRKWTEEHFSKEKMINESVENESLEPDEVDLSSFKIKNSLNPKFWKNEKLDNDARNTFL